MPAAKKKELPLVVRMMFAHNNRAGYAFEGFVERCPSSPLGIRRVGRCLKYKGETAAIVGVL